MHCCSRIRKDETKAHMRHRGCIGYNAAVITGFRSYGFFLKTSQGFAWAENGWHDLALLLSHACSRQGNVRDLFRKKKNTKKNRTKDLKAFTPLKAMELLGCCESWFPLKSVRSGAGFGVQQENPTKTNHQEPTWLCVRSSYGTGLFFFLNVDCII